MTTIIDGRYAGFASGTFEAISSTPDVYPAHYPGVRPTTRDQASHQGRRKTGPTGFSLLPGGQRVLIFTHAPILVFAGPCFAGSRCPGDLPPDNTFELFLGDRSPGVA
jgi:hypothetical protein